MDFARIREALDQHRPGHTLPQPFYTDPEIFAFDLDAAFAHSWIMAGFEAELPLPGSTLAFTVGRSPVVLVRGRDGAIRGFHNTCRHRGAQVVAEGRARAPRLMCPYHQWVYELDGRLVHTKRMQEDFDPATHGLRPLAVETVAGTIYVSLDEAPDFSPFRDVLGPMLAPHRLERGKLAFETKLVERGNWKLVMENARECYHCAVRHPELSTTFPVRAHRNYEADGDARVLAFNDRVASLGFPVGSQQGDWWQVARFPLNEGMVSLTLDGQPAVKRPLCDADRDLGSLRWALDPHCFAHAVADHVFFFSANPVGPEETIVTAKWLVHEDAQEGVDYDLTELTELWNRTNQQDLQLVELNQRGVLSRGYTPGPFSDDAESLAMRFNAWYDRKASAFLAAHGA
jgi:Rieske 2Fe-2S family protein